MESNNNLESLRELSESQLEALLRYESPPETPIKPTDPLILQDHSNQKDLNIAKNDVEANSFNCFNNRNREQFGSQIDSQIDFSIFHSYSPNAQWSFSPLNMQLSETEHSIIVASQIDTVDNSAILIRDKEESNFEDEFFNEKQGQAEHINESSCSRRNESDLRVIDNIFKRIEYTSNIDVSHMNKCDGSNCEQRNWQTQIELKSNLKNSHEKIITSCPPHTGKHYLLACNSTNPTKLLPNNATIFYQESGTELNNVNFSGIPQRDGENKTQCTSPCLSFDKNLNDNLVEMPDIFEKTQPEHILDAPRSIEQQLKVQTDANSHHLFHEDEKSQAYTSPNSSKNINVQMDASSIPFSVRQLYDVVKTNYSDFAFIYALSSQLCQDRVPMDCFVTLKMGLLLSLVSIGNNESRPPIPIVAMTNDTYMTDYLMTNIGQLGSRFLGPMDETKSFSNVNWIEADPILLARGGVYYAGDWTRIKLRRAENIFKNIECSSVAVEKSNLSFPLETAIWTHWRSFKYGAKDQQTFNKFLKIFGLPIFVSDDNHLALIDYMLEQSSIRVFESTVDHLSINEDDMRNFLICVSQNNVELSPEASLILKNYFVASRSIRQDCLSKQSYTMLKQFAESFAKLSMRKVVLYDDALAAIIMCEHFIENIFSSCNNSPPHFGNFNFICSIDTYLMQFKKWLDNYIEKFTNE